MRRLGAVLWVKQDHDQGCPLQQVVGLTPNRHNTRDHQALVRASEPENRASLVPVPFTILERLVQDGLDQGARHQRL